MRLALNRDDLAPGDRTLAADARELEAYRIASADDPEFALAYDLLWEEFGPRGEMETRDVIADRLGWDPARPVGAARFAYELVLLRRRGELVALRDHTAVLLEGERRAAQRPVVVHLSHALALPAQRGTGLAPWLRALPVAAARRCAAAASCAPAVPIVLAAEMEPPLRGDAPRAARMRSYQRAGFRKIDPGAAPYAQPDFRSAGSYAGSPPKSVPLELVLRRVGRESESELSAAEVAAIVEAIYAVYAVHVPEAALGPLRRAAARWTRRTAVFRLVPPLGG